MTKVNEGDYLLCSLKGSKDFLMKVKELSKGEYHGTIEKDCHIREMRKEHTVRERDIILNLGPSPKAGKVYGIDTTNLYRGKRSHSTFGEIHFFYNPKKEVVQNIMAAFDKAYKHLERLGLEFLIDDIVWEILPFGKERYAGMYTRKKGEKGQPRILIRPERMQVVEFPYVILHELGHHLHMGGFVTSKKIDAQWVQLYNTSVRVASIDKQTSKSLLENLLDGQDTISNFKSSLDEDDALALKWILRTIQQYHGLSVRELDTLFEANMMDDIKAVWPLRNIPHKELTPVITEYATKNYRETFAESFGHYAAKLKLPGKKDLPSKVVQLLEKTIAHAKANAPK